VCRVVAGVFLRCGVLRCDCGVRFVVGAWCVVGVGCLGFGCLGFGCLDFGGYGWCGLFLFLFLFLLFRLLF